MTFGIYLIAGRSAQISLGLPDPREQSSLPLLKRIQAGIKWVRALKGSSNSRVCLPITMKLLRGIQEELEWSTDGDKVLLWAVACLAFFRFFRLGELL